MTDEVVQSSGNQALWVRIAAFLSLKSPGTRRTYAGIVSEWCTFLGGEAGSARGAALLTSATDLHAAAYRRWLEERPGERPRGSDTLRRSTATGITVERLSSPQGKKTGLENTQSNATIHKKFAALRRIYRVLMAHDLGVTQNPFDTDRTPPPPKDAGRKRPTEMIDFDLVLAIVNGPDISHPKGVRDRAILAALFGGGLRRSEITGLHLGDVRKSAAGTTYLYLRHTKARKDAEQALPEWAAEHIWRQSNARRAEGASDAEYLFVGFTGQGGRVPTNHPISDAGVYHLFKTYCAIAGAGPFVTPHSARATAITKLLADGIPHRDVQAFSRHSSIQMVELYDKRRFDVERNPAKGLSFKKRQ